jgi:serine/threonine-protein kinase
MAEVYIGRDLRTGFNRAVKVLGPGYGANSEFMKRFLAEGETARQCSHPNIVTTYEVDQAHGLTFIAMEYLQGETLKTLLVQARLGTMPERLNIAWQVAHGVRYLHQQNIIHRDLKPENVNVDPLGNVKIFDFGVAKIRSQRITGEGQLVGTPLYMSPEQVRGETVTQATDVYSFGVLLFVMFTGAFPYRAVSRDDLYASIVFHPPDLSPLEGKGIPSPLPEIITQCLQKQPTSRPSSFREIEEQLRALASPEAVGTRTLRLGTREETFPIVGLMPQVAVQRPAPAPQRKAGVNWLAWLLPAFLLVAAAGAGALWYARHPRSPGPRIAARGGYMVLVPSGRSFLGKDRRTVEVAGFYIDRSEVSNDAYREFARARGHALPDESQEQPATYPVVNVSYDDASAFCAWAGKRLPSDLEWEKAARGAEGRLYPWGNEPRVDLVNLPYGTEAHELQPVESNLAGASPYGAINLLGNVWEWVAKGEHLEEADVSNVELDPPAAIDERAFQIRGGSFRQRIDLAQAVWDFAAAPARLKRADIGFRCARGL